MILSFKPSLSREAKVWFDELPQTLYEANGCLEHAIIVSNRSLAATGQVAAEMMIPTGGRALYGLLGAQMHPKETNSLILKVLTSKFEGPPFASTVGLPPPSDYIRIGLPKEYASSIVEGVLSAQEQLGSLPTGELIFNCAAHGLAGSSQEFFKCLGNIIVQLLSLDESHRSEGELAEIFKQPL